jgi:catechol 2,3-dioxygenase-like lactoylglutathione lyase family enzyme
VAGFLDELPLGNPRTDAPAFVGLHHVRLPSSDVMCSRDWYVEVFGFEPRLTLEEEERVLGAVVGHRNGLTIGFHAAPALARALAGFCVVALNVGAPDALRQWSARLDALGVVHSAPTEGHLGWYIEVPDPDRIVVELHTVGQPSADEA